MTGAAMQLEVGRAYEVAFGQVEDARRTWQPAVYEEQRTHPKHGNLYIFRLNARETYVAITLVGNVRPKRIAVGVSEGGGQ